MNILQDSIDVGLKNFGKVVVRFAPSPTGSLHVGNTRTALINDLFYHASLEKNVNNPDFVKNSRFILRIDDTDKTRSRPEHEASIIADLAWLGIHTNAFYRQSERMELYRAAMQSLIASGRLYPCYETAAELDSLRRYLQNNKKPFIYDRRSLKLTQEQKQALETEGVRPHWRFLLLDKDIVWQDRIRGAMHFKAASLSDPILIKENGEMTYTLASVVDDIAMGVTDIIRGEDHLSNSATHIQIFEALGAPYIPNFAHLSLLYNKDQEISKRLGGFEIANLRSAGIEPESIRAFFSKIGSSEPVQVAYDKQELVKSFDFSKFNRASVHYDFRELEILNNKLVQNMDFTQASPRICEVLRDSAAFIGKISKIAEEVALQAINANIADLGKMQLFWQCIGHNIEKFAQVPQWYCIFFIPQKLWPELRQELVTQGDGSKFWRKDLIAHDDLSEVNADKEALILQPEFCQGLSKFLPVEPWDVKVFDSWIASIKAANATGGRKGKELFLPLRLALTGLPKGPDLSHVMLLLGRDEVVARLNNWN